MILQILSYIAATALFAFVTLSLASGLLFLAEVVEEHSKLAKVVGQRAIYGIITLLIVLCFVDGLPLYLTALGVFSHLIYLLNFSKSWPKTSLTSPAFLLSIVLVCLNHYVHFKYFSEHSRENRHPYRGYGAKPVARSSWNSGPTHDLSFMEISSFFGVCVWSIPLFLFLSLSANDNVLPSSGESTSSQSQSKSSSANSGTPKSNRPHLTIDSPSANSHRRTSSMLTSAVQSAFSLVPSSLRGGARRSNNQHEGIIASPSRSIPGSPLHSRPPSAMNLNSPSRNSWNGAQNQSQRTPTGEYDQGMMNESYGQQSYGDSRLHTPIQQRRRTDGMDGERYR